MKLKFVSMLGLCLFGIFSFAVSVRAAEANWLTDYDKALAQAKEENKKVLIDFTGSTWCPPCIQMHKDVLTKKEFIDYADKNLVLLLVDLPRGGAPSPTVQKLTGQYKIQVVPTYVVLNPQGREIDRATGYRQGGPKAFTDWLAKVK